MSRPRRRRTVPRRADPAGLAARRATLKLLDAVLERGAMLEDARAGGTGAERAQARSLADLTLRRLGQIDAVLERFVERPPKGSARQILRLMAGELLFAGTPPHAAVDIAVRLARSDRGTGRLAGLINAVGRRLAKEGAAIVAGQDAPRLNTPGWLQYRLARDWGESAANHIAAAHLEPPAHDLTLKSGGNAEPLARETGGTILPTGSLRLPDRPQISALPGYAEGAWWVQDAAAALPARLIPEPRGKRVLDLCAAPGGKTLQLAAAGAIVTALDSSEHRMDRLVQNLARTGLSAETVTADALIWQPDTRYDAILLDAPCSATGTIRRHPDLPHRIDGRGMTPMLDLQAKLLDRAFGWLTQRGVLVFCTCSLLKSEGEVQASAFLSRTPEAAPLPIALDEGIPAEMISSGGWLRTRPDFWPEFGGLDGFFAARVRRAP